MPRAEIPECVEPWTIVDSGDVEREAILVSDLPKLYAHWLAGFVDTHAEGKLCPAAADARAVALEQLKEELLSKEQIHALTKEIVEGSDGEVISLPYRTVEDALRGRLQSLASIPIEEGGDGR